MHYTATAKVSILDCGRQFFFVLFSLSFSRKENSDKLMTDGWMDKFAVFQQLDKYTSIMKKHEKNSTIV